MNLCTTPESDKFSPCSPIVKQFRCTFTQIKSQAPYIGPHAFWTQKGGPESYRPQDQDVSVTLSTNSPPSQIHRVKQFTTRLKRASLGDSALLHIEKQNHTVGCDARLDKATRKHPQLRVEGFKSIEAPLQGYLLQKREFAYSESDEGVERDETCTRHLLSPHCRAQIDVTEGLQECPHPSQRLAGADSGITLLGHMTSRGGGNRSTCSSDNGS